MADAVAGRHLQVTQSSRRGALRVGLVLLPLAFLVLFFAWPVASMAWRGLAGESGLDLPGLFSVLQRPRVGRVLWFTVWMAVAGTACSVLLGVPIAHLLYRRRVPMAGLLRAVIMLPFVLPTVVVGVAFRSVFADSGPGHFLGWDGTWVPILLAMVFFNVSVVVRTVGPMWAGLDPRAAQAAASLSASPREVFTTVTWPALRPAVVSASSVVFLFCASAFGIVLMLGGLRYSTLETEIYTQTVQFLDLRAAAVLSLTQLVFVCAVLGVSERARRGLARAKHAGGDEHVRRGVAAHSQLPRASSSDFVSIAAAVVVYLLILTPLVTLVHRSLTGDDGYTLQHYRTLEEVPQALATSWRIAVDSALLALILGALASAAVTYRAKTAFARRVLSVLDASFMLPLGVSAVTVGFGFLITLDRPPLDLRSSSVLIPIAQAVVALPLVMRTLVPVLRSIDPRAREAAAALGAGPVRAWFTADFPVLVRPFCAAAGFALAVSLGEFGATSFLAQPDSPTLPVLIYRLIGRPGPENFGAAMAASVILAVVTAAVMALVDKVGGSAAGRM